MTSNRIGKWADADESDDDEVASPGQTTAPMFETKADESGIKLIIDYKEKDGKTYKVTRRIRETKITSWTNEKITERLTMKKFGKPVINGDASEKIHVVRSEENIPILLSEKKATNVVVKDEAEEKFYEESLVIASQLASREQKKTWTEVNKDKQLNRDGAGTNAPTEPDKPAESGLKETMGNITAMAGRAAVVAKDGGPRAYVPPSLRGGGGGGKDDGKGKGKGQDNQQEQSLRVTNLSEFAKEGDLQDLFSSVGRLQRVYLAKDDDGYSRGFAFVTYYSREDALKAIAKLHGFGYDNLILQVAFAKPRV